MSWGFLKVLCGIDQGGKGIMPRARQTARPSPWRDEGNANARAAKKGGLPERLLKQGDARALQCGKARLDHDAVIQARRAGKAQGHVNQRK
jgi:hypothetical protein